MDIEGHEKDVICRTDYDDWKNVDALISLHDEENAQIVFNHFKKIGIKMYSQKIGWKEANKKNDIPMTPYQGTMFVSNRYLPWK